jgi:hypothetical protein
VNAVNAWGRSDTAGCRHRLRHRHTARLGRFDFRSRRSPWPFTQRLAIRWRPLSRPRDNIRSSRREEALIKPSGPSIPRPACLRLPLSVKTHPLLAPGGPQRRVRAPGPLEQGRWFPRRTPKTVSARSPSNFTFKFAAGV